MNEISDEINFQNLGELRISSVTGHVLNMHEAHSMSSTPFISPPQRKGNQTHDISLTILSTASEISRSLPIFNFSLVLFSLWIFPFEFSRILLLF